MGSYSIMTIGLSSRCEICSIRERRRLRGVDSEAVDIFLLLIVGVCDDRIDLKGMNFRRRRNEDTTINSVINDSYLVDSVSISDIL